MFIHSSIRILLTAGVLAAGITGFTACDSATNSSTTDTHEGHAATQATVVNVPDYSSAAAQVKQPLDQLFAQYIQMKDALVAGNAAEAKEAATGVVNALGTADTSALSAEQKDFFEKQANMIRQHAQLVAQTDDLETQRKQLDMFSTSTYALLKAFAANNQTLYYQHCPMANNEEGGNWISLTAEIKNPYFGKKMIECGETKEVLK